MGSDPKAEASGIFRVVLSLALAGSAALSLMIAAASRLESAWHGSMQIGSSIIGGECQPATQPVQATLGEPKFDGDNVSPWTITTVEISGIHPDCSDHSYEAAYLSGAQWVSLAKGTISGSTISIPLIDAAVDELTQFTLTINR